MDMQYEGGGPGSWSRRRWAFGLSMAGLAGGWAAAAAAPERRHGGGAHRAHRPEPDCTDAALSCAKAATPFFDRRGGLWMAWSGGGAVSVARSADHGRSFGPPVVVGRHGDQLDLGTDARPCIVADAKGRITVAYGVFKDAHWNAQVLVARSLDGGATFSAPRPLSQDVASQRFPVLAVRTDGTLFAAWLDKRTAAAARRAGRAQPGAALAYAWSRDGGASFVEERIAQDRTCECCRIGLALDAGGRPVVLFRNIYGESERDHALLSFDKAGTPGPVHRVSADRWDIDGCPHHGPSLALAADGSVHAAWFTLGQAREGLFHARSTDGGRSFSAPSAVGDPEQQPGRPALLALGSAVWLVWKEFDGQRIFVKQRWSSDAGRRWSADRVVGTATGYTDHPQLVTDGRRIFLSWLTHDHGHRFVALEAS